MLGPTLNQVLSDLQKNSPSTVSPQAVSGSQTGCGRRKRQADGEERSVCKIFDFKLTSQLNSLLRFKQ